jgi:hypothetical protein
VARGLKEGFNLRLDWVSVSALCSRTSPIGGASNQAGMGKTDPYRVQTLWDWPVIGLRVVIGTPPGLRKSRLLMELTIVGRPWEGKKAHSSKTGFPLDQPRFSSLALPRVTVWTFL